MDLAKFEEYLNNLKEKVGLSHFNNPFGDKYLTMSLDELKCLNQEECALACIMLAKHATFLSSKINRQKSIKEWCDRNIRKIIVQHYDDYDKFTKWEARRELIILHNDMAAKLNQIYNEASTNLTELFDMNENIKYITDQVKLLYHTRRSESWNNSKS